MGESSAELAAELLEVEFPGVLGCLGPVVGWCGRNTARGGDNCCQLGGQVTESG